MATKTIQTKVDDIDGSPAVASFTFTFQGASYYIDLSAAHAAELKADVAKWVSAAHRLRNGSRKPGALPVRRKVAEPAAQPVAVAEKPAAKPAAAPRKAAKAAPKPRGRRAAVAKKAGPEIATMRAWALAQGLTVADRGRLAPAIVEAYSRAHAA